MLYIDADYMYYCKLCICVFSLRPLTVSSEKSKYFSGGSEKQLNRSWDFWGKEEDYLGNAATSKWEDKQNPCLPKSKQTKTYSLKLKPHATKQPT